MAGKEKGREPFLKVLFDESLVIFGTDDMGAVAIERHADGISCHAYGEVAQIMIWNAPEGSQLRYGFDDFFGRDRIPFFEIAAEYFFEMIRESSEDGIEGNRFV